MKKLKFTLSLCLLLFLCIASTAYAKTVSTLGFSGSVTVADSPRLSLEIADAVIDFIRAEESLDLSLNKRTLRFNVLLFEPGDQRVITFRVKNNDSLPALLQNLVTHDPELSTGVRIVWPTLENITLMPGSLSDEFTIHIMWEPSAVGVPEGMINFDATLQYLQI